MAFGIGNCQNSEQSEKAVTKYYKAICSRCKRVFSYFAPATRSLPFTTSSMAKRSRALGCVIPRPGRGASLCCLEQAFLKMSALLRGAAIYRSADFLMATNCLSYIFCPIPPLSLSAGGTGRQAGWITRHLNLSMPFYILASRNGGNGLGGHLYGRKNLLWTSWGAWLRRFLEWMYICMRWIY